MEVIAQKAKIGGKSPKIVIRGKKLSRRGKSLEKVHVTAQWQEKYSKNGGKCTKKLEKCCKKWKRYSKKGTTTPRSKKTYNFKLKTEFISHLGSGGAWAGAGSASVPFPESLLGKKKIPEQARPLIIN